GQLYVSERENYAKGSELAQFMREAAGIQVIPIDANGVREAEPTLAPIYKSGLLLPDNGRVKNPHHLVTILANETTRQGGEIVRGRVTAFQREGDRVKAMVVDGTAMPIDRLLIAAGVGSR